MKRLLIALAFVASCIPAQAHMHGYQFAPSYRPGAPKVAPAVTGDYSGIRSVAVLSGLGNLELEISGPAGKRTGAMDIRAWQIDDRVEACVRQALKDRFRFVNVAYDRRALAALRGDVAHAGRFAGFLKTVPAGGIDAYVVVRPNAIGALALQSIVHRDTILWTDFEIDVIDAHTQAVIGSASARVQPPGTTNANFPGLVVGRDYALDPALQLDPRKIESLRLLTDEMLSATVIETLAAMGLGR